MSSKIDLHIISFDVPYPPDYGGLIDVYYKLKTLNELGLQIALHCFHYGRPESAELKEVCAEVNYYPRKTGIMAQFSTLPYIVASRSDANLMERLKKDDAPILFEGLHTTFLLSHASLEGRKKAVRIHNREDQYYAALYEQSPQIHKKLYYKIESSKLKYYESRLAMADRLFTLSENEQSYFSKWHSASTYLAVFHPYADVHHSADQRIIDQAVYFGNLSVEENITAVKFLLKAFDGLAHPLKIAGKNAPTELLKLIEAHSNAEYLGELSNTDLDRLIMESKVCCLPTFQDTGIKLKWVHALHLANAIVLNKEMLSDDVFKEYCSLANSISEWQDSLKEIFESDLPIEKINKRRELARRTFDNKLSANLLVEWCAPAQ